MSVKTQPSAAGASPSPLPDDLGNVVDIFRRLESGLVAGQVISLGSAG
jgi:hypothetical protein